MERLSQPQCDTNLLPTRADDVRYPNLVQRRGTYYFRRRIPADLHAYWQGGLVVVKSLNTRDRRVAVERLHAVQGELQRKIDDCRTTAEQRFARAPHAELSGAYELTDTEIADLVGGWKRERLKSISSTADGALSYQDAQLLSAELDRDIALFSSPVTEEVEQEVGTIVNRLLIRAGVPSVKGYGAIKLQAKDAGVLTHPISDATMRKMFASVREAENHLASVRRDAVRGRRSAFSLLSVDGSPKAPYRLADLIRDFSNDPGRGRRTDKTNLDYGMLFRAMRDVIGNDKMVSEISRVDCTKIRDLFIALPRDATKRHPGKLLTEVKRQDHEPGLRPKTINSHLSKMASIFAWAVAEQRLIKSPALKLHVAQSEQEQDREKRRSFTIEELKTMFNSPLYTGCKDDERNFSRVGTKRPRRSRFWVPLIALFSGLRQTEICQLTPRDIESLDGVRIIRVQKSEPGQKLKTTSSKRYVPIHPELLSIGLVEYADEMRRRGSSQLFPELKADIRGYKGAIFQKRFNAFRNRLGICDPSAVFHSFRHTWRDAVRNARIPVELAQVLGGWAGQGQDKKYGSERFNAKTRFEEIEKISFQGLDLSHLHTKSIITDDAI